jgi:hypothetical protein
LVEAILIEQDDEWAVAERRYISVESMQRLLHALTVSTDREPMMAIA